MYLSGLVGNAVLQSSLQKPITTPLYSRVILGSTSASFRGHLALNAFLAAAFFSSFLGSAFFSSAGALNSATLPMYSSGLAANLPQQPFQQKPIAWPL